MTWSAVDVAYDGTFCDAIGEAFDGYHCELTRPRPGGGGGGWGYEDLRDRAQDLRDLKDIRDILGALKLWHSRTRP